MKITGRLWSDHQAFRSLLIDLEAISNAPPGRRDLDRARRLLASFKEGLVRHSALEDNHYYPAVAAAIRRAPHPILTDAYMKHLNHEHETIDRYLVQLERQITRQPPESTWPQTYALFSRGLETHMRREEQELFPISEGLLGEAALEDLGARDG